jgi:hypothetical protein
LARPGAGWYFNIGYVFHHSVEGKKKWFVPSELLETDISITLLIVYDEFKYQVFIFTNELVQAKLVQLLVET